MMTMVNANTQLHQWSTEQKETSEPALFLIEKHIQVTWEHQTNISFWEAVFQTGRGKSLKSNDSDTWKLQTQEHVNKKKKKNEGKHDTAYSSYQIISNSFCLDFDILQGSLHFYKSLLVLKIATLEHKTGRHGLLLILEVVVGSFLLWQVFPPLLPIPSILLPHPASSSLSWQSMLGIWLFQRDASYPIPWCEKV